jgi:hypothetical protein
LPNKTQLTKAKSAAKDAANAGVADLASNVFLEVNLPFKLFSKHRTISTSPAAGSIPWTSYLEARAATESNSGKAAVRMKEPVHERRLCQSVEPKSNSRIESMHNQLPQGSILAKAFSETALRN